MISSSSSPAGLPAVSVIVPVYGQASQVCECLLALSRQTYSADRFEVIVVDNDTAGQLDEPLTGFPGIRIVHEPRTGSYAARNRGVREARGDVLAFTDADCLPHADWIESGVEALTSDPEAVAVGGRVCTFPRDSRRMNVIELHQTIGAFPQQRYVEQLHFAATANLFTYRRVFESVGAFDERLLSSGDWEWGQRLFQQQLGRLIYAESVCVRHPAIRGHRELAAKTRRVAGGWFQLARLGKHDLATYLLCLLLVAPWMRWISWRSHPQLRSAIDWWRLLLIEWMVALISVGEVFRLALGGQPRRQ